MKLKLDENFDVRIVPWLQAEGHDVDTVPSEGLCGSDDATIYRTCQSVGRALMTLDLDFANPFRFPPETSHGIVVVRPPRPILAAVRATLSSVLPQLKAQPLQGKLWIVEPGRLRIYEADKEL